jgi:ABC-type antimicrobial peptide transport system permease subunit
MWGVYGALTGGAVGLVVGFVSAFGIFAAGKACWRWHNRCKDGGRSTYWPSKVMGYVYLIGFAWSIVSAVGGQFITKAAIHALQ